jgi:hypothetical protein
MLVASTIVAGCGSADESSTGDDQPSATQVWADDMCASFVTWRKTLADARTSLSNPKELSVADLEQIGEQVRTATTTMVTDLKKADVPTQAGTAVRQQLSQLTDEVEEQVQLVEDADVGSASTPQDVLQQVSVVAGALSAIAADSKAALVDMRESIDSTGLGDAFASSPACQDLDIGGSGNG